MVCGITLICCLPFRALFFSTFTKTQWLLFLLLLCWIIEFGAGNVEDIWCYDAAFLAINFCFHNGIEAAGASSGAGAA